MKHMFDIEVVKSSTTWRSISDAVRHRYEPRRLLTIPTASSTTTAMADGFRIMGLVRHLRYYAHRFRVHYFNRHEYRAQ